MRTRFSSLVLLGGVALSAACKNSTGTNIDLPSQAIVFGTVTITGTPVNGALIRVVSRQDSTCVAETAFSDTANVTSDSQGRYRAMLIGPALRRSVCVVMLVISQSGGVAKLTSVMMPNAVTMDVKSHPDSVLVNVLVQP